MIKKCFNDDFIEISVERLMYTKSLPENVKKSYKYNQIKSSIKEIGVVEPIIIYPDSNGTLLKILDGHLRVEAAKDISMPKISCIISTINDSYTPNKQVNRLTIIQEHRMIKKAIESGVSIEKLSSALGISIDTIKARFNITKGVVQNVIDMLADKQIPINTFDVLRKMKAIRQIEASNIMINFDNFTTKFALSLLHTTEPNLLVGTQKKKDNTSMKDNLIRLEREMVSIQVETDNIKNTYAEKVIKLQITKNHIAKLLNSPKVLLWLLEHKPDYLSLLKKISDIDDINVS